MNDSYLLLVAVFLLCLVNRCVYELLKEAGKIDLENKPLFAFIFTSMCILWVSWFVLCPSDPRTIPLPAAVRWLGFAVFIAGTLLAVGALIQLRGVENIDHLVTTGLFRRLRHPMYVGFLSWIVGWSLYHAALTSFGVGLFGIACVLWWRHLEERRLLVQFGTAYQTYRETTWF